MIQITTDQLRFQTPEALRAALLEMELREIVSLLHVPDTQLRTNAGKALRLSLVQLFMIESHQITERDCLIKAQAKIVEILNRLNVEGKVILHTDSLHGEVK